jgi:hypothetical protein
MQDGPRYLTETDLNVLTTTKQTQFGAKGITEDGRHYRYVSFGGTSTIAPGLVIVAAANTANFQGVGIPAVATTASGQVTANLNAGATQIVLQNTTSTTATQDQFAEGFLHIIVGGSASPTGQYSYRIRGNTPVTAGNVTTSYYTVFLAEPLRNTTALVGGTDTANLELSPYSTVNTSTTAALPIGVTIMPVPNTASVTNYGWVQTVGDCNLINDAGGTITVGGAFAQSTTTAGNIVAATASVNPAIGVTRTAITASHAGQVFVEFPSI